MSKEAKPWSNKQVDQVEQKEDKEDTDKVKVNWSRIVLMGFLSSIVLVFINILVFLIFYYGVGSDVLAILDFMQYIIFGEAGLVVFIGACMGNFGQSALVSKMKERFSGGEPLTKDSFREATFNAFTYYFGAAFLILYGLVFDQIVKLVIRLG